MVQNVICFDILFQFFGISFSKLLIDHQELFLSLQKTAFHEMHHFEFSVLTDVNVEPTKTLV